MRWAVHPSFAAGEALSSWIIRLADRFAISPLQLLTGDLGSAPASPDEIDTLPDPKLIHRLSYRTGIPARRIVQHTTQSIIPAVSPAEARLLDTSLLLPMSITRVRQPRATHWTGLRLLRRDCAACEREMLSHPVMLMWRLPLSLGCLLHHRALDLYRVSYRNGRPSTSWRSNHRSMPIVRGDALDEAAALHERRLHEAIHSGCVTLPGGTVSAALWFGLLHLVLEELLAPAFLRHVPRDTLDALKVWPRDRTDVAAFPFATYEGLGHRAQIRFTNYAARVMFELERGRLQVRGSSELLALLGRRGSGLLLSEPCLGARADLQYWERQSLPRHPSDWGDFEGLLQNRHWMLRRSQPED